MLQKKNRLLIISVLAISVITFSCNNKKTNYYENGQIESEGFIKDGMKQGEWIYFEQNGDTLQILNYLLDSLNGKSFYYENNKLKSVETYKNGIEHGENIFYYESGQVESKGQIENNVQEGELINFYPNGKLKGIYYMKNGSPLGEFKNYYQNGNIQSTGQPYSSGFAIRALNKRNTI